MEVFDYSDIVDYELPEDGNLVSKGGVGRALVGAYYLGALGQLLEPVQGISIKIHVQSFR